VFSRANCNDTCAASLAHAVCIFFMKVNKFHHHEAAVSVASVAKI